MSTPLGDALVATPATGRSDRWGAPHTRLRGRRLMLARVAWLAAASLIVALFLARLPAFYTELQTVCTGAFCGYVQPTLETAQALQKLGISVGAYAGFTLALEIALALLCFSLGAVIFWRRSDDWMALLGGLAVVTSVAFNGNVISMDMSSAWGWIAMGLFVFAGGLYLLVLSLADGRFVTRWAPLLLLCWAVAVIHYFVFMNYVYSLVWSLALGLLLIARAYHHRTAESPIQRQQSKWFIFGGCVQLIIAVATIVPALIFPSLWQNGSFYQLVANGLALIVLSFVFPICIGIGILRSRLYDIDIIISRTLVYGILTICIVGVYVLVVWGLGTLIGSNGNLLISLLATGLVAVLFHPLRAVLQRGVNRLLFGQRDEPYTVITQLSQRLDAQLSPDAVLSTIVETVAQALKLPYVAILLKQADSSYGVRSGTSASSKEVWGTSAEHISNHNEATFALAASAGELVGDPLVLPLVYQKETIGHMQLSPRTPGEPFTPADRRLLDELAHQAGLAAHAVQLTSDLQRSYEQLEQRVEERTRELSTLLEVSHNVASTLELKPLLDLILNQIKGMVEYTAATILIRNGEELAIVDYLGPAPRGEILQIRYPVRSTGVDDIVLRQGEPVIIDDVHAATPLAQDYLEAVGDNLDFFSSNLRALMVVPLKLKDRVIGMLSLASNEEGCYTPHHASLIVAIANQAAVAIENARLYAQAQELAALEERQKLARELHDSVSQALYGIAIGLHTARIQLDRDQEKLPETFVDLLSLAEAALAEMRALIFELRPESLEREGLVSALSKQGAALQARHDMLVHTDLCEEPALSLMVKQELYRIAQEALHNTVKHAHASKIDLILCSTANMVTLEVCDDGVGFDPQGFYPGHLGLRSMQERVSHLGGSLQIESAPGQGTHLLTKVPVLSADLSGTSTRG